MANIKSAKKRVLIAEAKRHRNVPYKEKNKRAPDIMSNALLKNFISLFS